MAEHLSAREARSRFAEVTDRVKYTGEPVIVEKQGRPFVALIRFEDLELVERLLTTERQMDFSRRAAEAAAARRGSESTEDEIVDAPRATGEAPYRERYAPPPALDFQELRYPGVKIEGLDQDRAFQAQMIIASLESALEDAAIVLSHFKDSSNQLSSILREMTKRENRRKNIPLPTVYQRRSPLVFAESFIHKLYVIRILIHALAGMRDVPPMMREIASEFDSMLPSLKGVRDSAQHLDERLQGKARGKPLPNGFLWLGNLNGNVYEMTMKDGSVGGVDVSEESVTTARSCIQSAIDSFEWSGPPPLSGRQLEDLLKVLGGEI